MKSSRLIVLLLLIGDIILFFMLQSELDDNGRWALVGLALLLAIAWVYLEEAPKQKAPVRRQQTVQPSQQQDESEPEIDIPPTVTEDELDGASLRERKLAKVRAANESEEAIVTIEPDDDLEEVQVVVEEVHVASEFVVESSPQSIEDAAIVAHIQEKRDRHDRVRARIEERRREQMAEIRASTAKMWEEHSSGEDLISIVQDPQNTHRIIEEPAIAKQGHVYGASLVRIDENTILKLRVPVDSGYVQVESVEDEDAPMPILPPGVPSPDSLGLPPLPPPPGASGALAALRDEMSND